MLARSDARSTLFALESVIFEVGNNNSMPFDRNEENFISTELLETLANDGYRVFDQLLRSYMVVCRYDLTTARYRKLCLPKLTYLLCWIPATLTAKVRNGFVVFDDER